MIFSVLSTRIKLFDKFIFCNYLCKALECARKLIKFCNTTLSMCELSFIYSMVEKDSA